MTGRSLCAALAILASVPLGSVAAQRAARPPATQFANGPFGVLAKLAGTNWRLERGAARSYRWKVPGEIMVIVSTDPDSEYETEVRRSVDGKSIAGMSRGSPYSMQAIGTDVWEQREANGALSIACRLLPTGDRLMCEYDGYDGKRVSDDRHKIGPSEYAALRAKLRSGAAASAAPPPTAAQAAPVRAATVAPPASATPGASSQTTAAYFGQLVAPYLDRTFVCNSGSTGNFRAIRIVRVDADHYSVNLKWKWGDDWVEKINTQGWGSSVESSYFRNNGSLYRHLQMFPRGFRTFSLTGKQGGTFASYFIAFDGNDTVRLWIYYDEKSPSYQKCDFGVAPTAYTKLPGKVLKEEFSGVAKLAPFLGAEPQWTLDEQVAANLLAIEPQKGGGLLGGIGKVLGGVAKFAGNFVGVFADYNGGPVNAGSNAWQPSTAADWSGRIQGTSAPRYTPQQQAQADELERFKMREQTRLGQRATTFNEDAQARATGTRSPLASEPARRPADPPVASRQAAPVTPRAVDCSRHAEPGCMVSYQFRLGYSGKSSNAFCYSPVKSLLLPSDWIGGKTDADFRRLVSGDLATFASRCRARLPAGGALAGANGTDLDSIQIESDWGQTERNFTLPRYIDPNYQVGV